MSDDTKGTPNAFSLLVKAKLAERKMSQAELGRRISRGPGYMSYLVRGENRASRRRTFQPAAEVVKSVARELGIPMEEALIAAGHNPALASRGGPQPEVTRGAKQIAPAEKHEMSESDQRIFDIAYEAALEAIRTGGETGRDHQPTRIKIKLREHVDVIIVSEEKLTKNEIDRLGLAFRVAYETVRREMAGQKASSPPDMSGD